MPHMEQENNPMDPTYMQISLLLHKQSRNYMTKPSNLPSTKSPQLIFKVPPKSPNPKCNPSLENLLLNQVGKHGGMEKDLS